MTACTSRPPCRRSSWTTNPSQEILQGQSAGIILEKTPFYAESGGQVGDQGTLECEQAVFEVADTQQQGDAHVHYGTLASGRLALGHKVRAKVATGRRQATVLNHSATHLMHAALREVLGDHVEQKGSLVAPDRLRFDFSHDAPLDETELQADRGPGEPPDPPECRSDRKNHGQGRGPACGGPGPVRGKVRRRCAGPDHR